MENIDHNINQANIKHKFVAKILNLKKKNLSNSGY